MTVGLFVPSLVFVIGGCLLLAIRLIHISYWGEFWNNTPLTLTWGVTIICAGAAVALVGFVATFEDECGNGCEPVGGNTAGGTMLSGGITAAIGAALIFCPCCCKRDPKTIYYDWGTGEDNRGYMSGVDFVAIGIGAGMLITISAFGDCPGSCAQAVVQAG